MKTKFLNYWEIVRSSYWFLPALMTGLAVVLSFLTVTLERRLEIGYAIRR